GVCQCHKQTEYPWSACQKAPSVTVTWGWGSCGLMVDLGNSAASRLSPQIYPLFRPVIFLANDDKRLAIFIITHDKLKN
ncbi:hypothetical protein, partial [Aeromonas caviae]|uniref:hypothetical protein n=1 Tax=Aeromonas caviae TaxID=648 RepID=UPI0025B658F7